MNFRKVFNLDKEWKFHIGEVEADNRSLYSEMYFSGKSGRTKGPAGKENFNTAEWNTIDIPHDYCLEENFSPDGLLSQGYRIRRNAWYRKTFKVDSKYQGNHSLLLFEGISGQTTVYLNGSIVGRSVSSYAELELDVTDRLYYGDKINTVAVHIDAVPTEGWWYEGLGIYRHVLLYSKPPVHIKNNGIWVNPRLIKQSDKVWNVEIKASVENSEYKNGSFLLYSKIYKDNLLIAEGMSDRQLCKSNECIEVIQNITVIDPIRWDIDNPALYTLETVLENDNGDTDCERTKFGFRTFCADPDKGFILNDRPIKIKGTCNHQDHAGVGIAVPDSIQHYRIHLLKEMGSNAYRCAHNMHSKAVLDACDEYGLIVMDENRHFECSQEVLSQIENMVCRDRNHPSVCFYSLFNEEPLQSTREGRAIYRRMKKHAEKFDNTKMFTGAIHENFNPEGAGIEMDVLGINYAFCYLDEIHKKYPYIPLLISESSSALATRGCYGTDRETAHVLSDYDEEAVSWGSTARKAWSLVRNCDFLSGYFIWSGFDFRGEPTPFEWPSCSAQYGIMDTCGFPKNAYFFNKACFTKEPMLHLLPHWNWNCGETVKVTAATNCEEVELFLNGESLGRKHSDVCESAVWNVEFIKGELKAVAYKNGKPICTDSKYTAGKPCKIILEPDRNWIGNGGEDAVPIKVYAVDDKGIEVPTADNLIKFNITGNGKIIGVGNGDPNSHESDRLPERKLYCGLCQLIVQADFHADSLVVTATSDGLESSSFSFEIVEQLHTDYIFSSVNTEITEILVSMKTYDQKPDPNVTYADNDVNTFVTLNISDKVQDFRRGWRIYRIPLSCLDKTGPDDKYALTIEKAVAKEIEAFIEGESVWKCGKFNGTATISVFLCGNKKTELTIMICADENSNEGNGIGGSIRMTVIQ